MSWALLWGVALAGVAALRTGVQLRHMHRAGSEGVSGASLAAWVAVNAGWVAYTLWVSLAAGLLSEVCYLLGSATLVARMRRAGGLTRRSLAFGVGVGVGYAAAAAVGAAMSGGPQLLGSALDGSVLCYGIPALVVALRSPSVTGLSRAALLITALDAGLAAVYGAAVHDRTYLLYGVLQQVLTLPVLVRVTLASRGPRNGGAVSARLIAVRRQGAAACGEEPIRAGRSAASRRTGLPTAAPAAPLLADHAVVDRLMSVGGGQQLHDRRKKRGEQFRRAQHLLRRPCDEFPGRRATRLGMHKPDRKAMTVTHRGLTST